MANKTLREAKEVKNDEFFTLYEEIQNEINAYLEYNPDIFRNKTILLPCDDPEWSNFTKFFAQNFERFGIKKLISTSYAYESKNIDEPYQISLFESKSEQYDAKKTKSHGKLFILEKDNDTTKKIDINNLKWKYLKGDGDFRTYEVKKLRDEADIIITNPPFSLFREFLNWIMVANKQFLIIGNMNAISYKEVYPYLIENKMWIGNRSLNKDMYFDVSVERRVWLIQNKKEGSAYKIINGKVMGRLASACWFTNIDHGRRHEKLQLMSLNDNIRFSKHKEINGIGYKKYDNYDALNIPFVDSIPNDYNGVMGVPITFMGVYNPEQFEILGFFNNYKPETAEKYQIYGLPMKIGTTDSKFRGPVIDGKAVYFRIIIKNKEV